jgi:hypothetical protein
MVWMGVRFDIKPTEGYVRTVPGASWQVAAVGDFDADGKADIFWRNAGTGENYLFPMTGNAIKPSEGYVRTVPDLNWRVHLAADFDGDGKLDLLWRRAGSGENYLFFMDGKTIKATEGYVRTVADPWRIAPGPAPEVVLPTLESIQRTVFTPRCAGCHGGGSPSAQMSLESGMSYGSLVNVDAKTPLSGKTVRVVPGDPDASVLVHRLQLAPGAPFFMPRNSTPLPQQAIDAIRAWVSALPQ